MISSKDIIKLKVIYEVEFLMKKSWRTPLIINVEDFTVKNAVEQVNDMRTSSHKKQKFRMRV